MRTLALCVLAVAVFIGGLTAGFAYLDRLQADIVEHVEHEGGARP